MIKNKRIKKWGYLISLFVLFLLLPFNVFAAKHSMDVTGDNAVSPGTTVTYIIELKPDGKVLSTDFSTTLSYDSSVLTLNKIEPGSGWEGKSSSVSSNSTIKFSSKQGVVGNTIVAKLVFKVKADVTSNTAYINLTNATFTYREAKEEVPEVLPPENNNENENNGTSGDGTEGNNSASNNITSDSFNEESEIGTLSPVEKKLTVKSSDNSLTNIKINGDSIEEFDSNVYEYDVTVDSKIEVAKITATTRSSKATLKLGNGNRDVTLNYGSNVVKIVVVSESGKEQIYTINITREDTRSTDTTLQSLKVDGVELSNFKSSIYKYTVKKYKASNIEIVGVPSDNNAKVVVTPPQKLEIGQNTYLITVTSEKGEVATYTVIIDNTDKTVNKKLKTLSIKGYDIDFDKNNNRYEISYNKTKFKDLHIYYSTVGSNDEVKAVMSPDINNNSEALSKLKVGDEITITITGIDGESTEYTIVITKDKRVSFFLILEILIIIILVVVIIVVANKRKKEKENPKNVTKKVDVKKENDKKNSSNKDKTKKRRFSIYEDDDFEEEDLSATKELTDEELNLK